MKHSHSVF